MRSLVLLCEGKEGFVVATPSGNGLLVVWIDIAPGAEGEFNEWYNVDHVPALVGVPGVYSARRYVALEGNPKYLAVYAMNDARIPKSADWDKARNSAWTLRRSGRTSEMPKSSSVAGSFREIFLLDFSYLTGLWRETESSCSGQGWSLLCNNCNNFSRPRERRVVWRHVNLRSNKC
jgi:hypothetical protein